MPEVLMERSVVETALERFGGSLTELARRLSPYVGEPVTRQRVFGWKQRGIFPREIIVAVSNLVGIPTEQLLNAKPRQLARGSVVDAAIDKAGDGSPTKFAVALSKRTGRKITRQMVNGWQARGQFPRDLVIEVHLLTKIPVEDLLRGGKR